MRMKRCSVLLIFLFLVPCILNAELIKVVSIGSNDLNYLFFKVSGAVLDKNGNIYVLDSKGSFLRKYDAQGTFVKEIGKLGQGPGDFSNVLSGLHLDGDLYLLDAGNSRIVEIDRDLNIKNYIRIRHQARGLIKINDLFYMISSRQGEPFSEIVIYNNKGEFKGTFFDQYPLFINSATSTKMEYALGKIYSDIALSVNKESEEVAIVFKYPGIKTALFLYSKEGQLIRKIDIDNFMPYDFPGFRLKWPVNYPGRSELISIGSIHYLSEGKILLEYWIEKYDSEKAMDQKLYLLVIDMATGNTIHKELVNSVINVMDARGNLLCAREEDGDIAKIVLYRFVY